MATLSQLEKLFKLVAEKTNHRNFVVVGSLSVIGTMLNPPEKMAWSMDVDTYLKADPNRHLELSNLGEHSFVADEIGCYADPVSPALISSEPGWEQRLIPISMPSGIVLWFMDINDAATAKMMRGLPRDISWVEAGLLNGIIQPNKLNASLSKVENALNGEINNARALLKIIINRMNGNIGDPDLRVENHEILDDENYFQEQSFR